MTGVTQRLFMVGRAAHPLLRLQRLLSELSEGNGRGAVVGKNFFGRDKNDNRRAGRDFNEGDRRRRLHFTNARMNMPNRDRNHRAIIVIGNRAAVQPFVKRRADFSRRHEQPHKQGQNPRRAVQIHARAAIELKWRPHYVFKTKQPS